MTSVLVSIASHHWLGKKNAAGEMWPLLLLLCKSWLQNSAGLAEHQWQQIFWHYCAGWLKALIRGTEENTLALLWKRSNFPFGQWVADGSICVSRWGSCLLSLALTLVPVGCCCVAWCPFCILIWALVETKPFIYTVDGVKKPLHFLLSLCILAECSSGLFLKICH